MSSSQDRNNCELCLIHGFQIEFSDNHLIKCPYVECNCDKCNDSVVNDGKQTAFSTLNTFIEKDTNSQICDQNEQKSNQKSIPKECTPKDPLEAVKSFTQQLLKTGISQKKLRTCVLYTLLESNDHCLEKTKQKLIAARTAMAESLVMPFMKLNESEVDQSDDDDSDEVIDISSDEDIVVPQKKICLSPKRFTARKSFPNNSNKSQIGINDSNSVLMTTNQRITDHTNPQTVEKQRVISAESRGEMSVMRKLLSETKNSSPIPSSHTQKSISIPSYSMIQSFQSKDIPISIDNINNCVTKPNIIFKKSIAVPQTHVSQTFIPQHSFPSIHPNTVVTQAFIPQSLVSQSVSNPKLNNKTPTTYILPAMPMMNISQTKSPTIIQLPLGVRPTLAVVSSSAKLPIVYPNSCVYTSASNGSIGSLQQFVTNHSSSANNTNTALLKTPSHISTKISDECALKGIKINKITKIGNTFPTNRLTNVYNACQYEQPELNIHSTPTPSNRFSNNNLVNNQNSLSDANRMSKNQFCAKIITSEAALAATSAISNFNTSIDLIPNPNKHIQEELILPNNHIISDNLNNFSAQYQQFLNYKLPQNKSFKPQIIQPNNNLLNQLSRGQSLNSGPNARYTSLNCSVMSSDQENNLNGDKNRNIIQITIDD